LRIIKAYGQGKYYKIKVDSEDYLLLKDKIIHVSRNGYPIITVKKVTTTLSRYILKSKSDIVSYIDGDKLNCQKYNLQERTRLEHRQHNTPPKPYININKNRHTKSSLPVGISFVIIKPKKPGQSLAYEFQVNYRENKKSKVKHFYCGVNPSGRLVKLQLTEAHKFRKDYERMVNESRVS
jgi:hypothetical protein